MAYAIAHFDKVRITEDGRTELIVSIANEEIGKMIYDKAIHDAEMRFDDGRTISNEQRRKAYALIDCISEWTGYDRQDAKSWMKSLYFAKTGEESISLKDCSVTEAREFINVMIQFSIENGIPLNEPGVNLTDDISRYLYYCLVNRKCCICGAPADIHHVRRIGMGANRNKIDDSDYPKEALCRFHHTVCHNESQETFDKRYHIYGIVAKDIEATLEDEGWRTNGNNKE